MMWSGFRCRKGRTPAAGQLSTSCSLRARQVQLPRRRDLVLSPSLRETHPTECHHPAGISSRQRQVQTIARKVCKFLNFSILVMVGEDDSPPVSLPFEYVLGDGWHSWDARSTR